MQGERGRNKVVLFSLIKQSGSTEMSSRPHGGTASRSSAESSRNLANKEQAERALELGQQYLRSGNPVKALKLFNKSKTLYPLPGITTWCSKAAAAIREQQKPKTSHRKPSSSSSSSSYSRSSSSSSSSSSGPRMRRARSAPDAPSSSARPTDPLVIEVMSKKNGHYYDILGIPNTATASQIKKAYRKMALKLHPDRNQTPGADAAFKRVGAAYAVLSDEQKKKEFDRWGPPEDENQTDGQAQQSRGFGRRRRGGGVYYEDEIDPNDIFRAFFGGGFPQGNVYRYQSGSFQRDDSDGSQNRGNAEPLAQMLRLLPLLLLFLFTFLQIPQQQTRVFSMQQTRRFQKARTTKGRCKSGISYAKCKNDPEDSLQGIRYFVEPGFKKKDHNMEKVRRLKRYSQEHIFSFQSLFYPLKCFLSFSYLCSMCLHFSFSYLLPLIT